MTLASREIAIVGVACRLPGAPSVDALWRLLLDGRDAVGEIGSDRWSTSRFQHPRRSEPGKTYTFAAGLLDDVYGFDPAFFEISPREAAQMDPQQRLLLEVAWEALEDAGLPASSLAGSGTGVYVGASSLDHGNLGLLDPAASDAQSATGNTLSILANRLSYVLDLRGPSFTIDTACSSSLLALHEAAEAIRAGRMDTAIVAGVNLLLSPFPFIGFARASMLSPTGRCHAFDARADGYVRAEGCVAVVLQAADRARDTGGRVRALLAASGTNTDGRTVGLSLPSAESQAALLEAVYAEAGIAPDTLAFVEAHGTGTAVGDPVEADSIGRALGRKRAAPLPIGSIKTNIGHLEPASGLAGVLKAVLALEHDLLPSSIHFATPNPNIPFDRLNLAVAGDALPLFRGHAPRFAGVNSFGFGGTNVHAVLRDPTPPAPPSPAVEDALPPLVISAQCEAALAELVRAYRERIAATPESGTAGLVAAASLRRDRLRHRLVLWRDDRAGLLAGLEAAERGDRGQAMTERALSPAESPVFVFSGNGAQWAGMGIAAYERNRAFRAAFDAVDTAFRPHGGWSLVEALRADDLEQRLRRAEFAQPLLFAVQVALAEALRTHGIAPAAVVGHSVGEVAAAHVAGALSLDQAIGVILARSRHQELTHGSGGMAALQVAAEETAAALADPRWHGLALAAVNAPRSVTLSGPAPLIAAFAKAARQRRWALRRLDLDYPFHCDLMEPVRTPLLDDLTDLDPSPTVLPMITTVDAVEVDGRTLTAEYWWRNVREPVRFSDAIDALIQRRSRLFLEIGPNPVLLGYVNECLREAGVAGHAIGGLERADQGDDPVRRIVARVLASGGAIDESRLFPFDPPHVSLPAYPWQRRTLRSASTPESWNLIGTGPDHPLLGFRPRPEVPAWTAHLDPSSVPYLADHRVDGAVVFPATGFVEMGLAAGAQWLETNALEIQDLEIVRPLVFDDGRLRETLLRLSPDDLVFEIHSRDREAGADWSQHVRGRITHLPSIATPTRSDVDTAEAAATIDAETIYARARHVGLEYGPAFARLRSVALLDEHRALVDLEPETSARDTGANAHLLHPATLDAAFHGLFALIGDDAASAAETVYLPARFGRLRYFGTEPPTKALLRLESGSRRSIAASVSLFDASGGCVAILEECRFRAMARARAVDPDRLGYHFTSVLAADTPAEEPTPAPSPAAIGRMLDAAGLTRASDAPPEEGWLLLDAFARSLAFEAVRAVVADEAADFTPSTLIDQGRLAPEAAYLFGRFLQLLDEDGLARQTEEGSWRLGSESSPVPAREVLGVVAASHPERSTEAALAARAMELVLPMLRGSTALPDEPPYAPSLLEQLEVDASGNRSAVDALVAAARAIVADWPSDRPLRVLELAAGAGALTRRILRDLPAERVTYRASDPDARIARQLEISLGFRPGLEVSSLDLGGAVAGARAAYDLVLSGGALHRAVPGGTGLAELLPLLAPGALFLAAEPEPSPFLDVINGLHAAWWHRSLVPELAVGPLDDRRAWEKAILGAGFVEAESLALAGPGPEHSLLIARAPERDEPADRSVAQGRAVLLIVDTRGTEVAVASFLARRLALGGRAVVVAGSERPDDTSAGEWLPGRPDDAEFLTSAIERLALDADEPPEIVHLAGAHADEDEPSDRIASRCLIATAALQALRGRSCRLWLVAPGAAQHLASGEAEHPTQAGLWAFGRVAINEYLGTEVRMIDPSPAFGAERTAELLARAVLRPTVESELVLNERGRHALRLHRRRVAAPHGPSVDPAAGLRLEVAHGGSLDRIAWRPMRRQHPEQGEVEIEVAATGLNFRDVMWGLGLLPDEALEGGFAGATLGLECAGVVTAVGEGVTGVHPGMRALAFAPACFASHVTVSTQAVAPIPADLTFEQAATIPSAFFTAYYALVHLARIERGERVLIHGGAGGVGLAALQIARWRGAEIFATAGTPEKRALLGLLGAEHVFDSRTLAFADQVMEATDGEGVDVVLNSLAGEAMERSLGIVRPFGRFLELGKRDFFAGSRLGLRPFRRNISYFGIDADQILVHRPRLAGRLFRETIDLFRDGSLLPLPYRRFEHEEAVDAFRLMQQSGHIGKIVVAAPPADARRLPETVEPLALRPDATYLVVGGLGGFGLATAHWLVERGARHLLLLGRTGAASEAASDGVAGLRAAGAEVTVEACDVADRARLDEVLERAARALPPIRGVLHTAMVLDDGLIANLDAERFARVLRPKVEGAHNLDRATRGLDLDFFVLFSSAAATVGNPGQGSYAAANAYLESLARRRQAEGLPGLAVGWGVIGDVGYLARNTEFSESLARRLMKDALQSRDALGGLERLLSTSTHAPAEASSVYARIDWRSTRGELPILAMPAFRDIVAENAAGPVDGDRRIDLRAALRGLDASEARGLVTRLLVDEVARILRIPTDDIDPQRPLTEMGMDSLMALELRMAVEQRLDIELPLMALSDSTTLGGIAARLCQRLSDGEGVTDEAPHEEALIELAHRHLEPDEAATAQDLVKASAGAGTGVAGRA